MKSREEAAAGDIASECGALLVKSTMELPASLLDFTQVMKSFNILLNVDF